MRLPLLCLFLAAPLAAQDPETPAQAAGSPGGAVQEAAAEPSHIGPHVVTLHGLASPVAAAFGPDGSLYVADEAANHVAHYGPDLQPLGQLGQGQLLAPQGVAVDGQGRVFVSTGAGRVLRLAEDKEPALVIAQRGGAPGQVNHPRGLAVAGDRLAVADSGGGRVLLFDLSGKPLGSWGAEDLRRPVDLAFREDGGLAVLDGESVLLLNATGEVTGRFGEWGAFPGLLSSPGGLAIHGERLFVCDTENHRVQVFGQDGAALYRWGIHAIRPREGKGKLHYPSHVALDASGNRAAICEPLDGRVQLFRREPGAEPEIDPLRALGGKPSAHYGHDWQVSGGHMAAIEPESRRILVYDLRLVPKDNPVQITEIGGYGEVLGTFLRPTGLWFDGPGRRLWICDGDQASLTEVHLDLEPEPELAYDPFLARVVRRLDLSKLSGGPLPRPFPITPRAVAEHPDGRLFVLCERNAEVLVLNSDLQPIAVFGGGDEAPLLRPEQILIDPDGKRLWVVDELGGAARAFDLDSERLGQQLETFTGVDGLSRPFGITFGPAGQLMVSDRATSRVHVRSADGTTSSFGSPGIRQDRFLGPRALGFDDRDFFYVLDHGNHRGMVLDAQGSFQYAFGPRLYTKPARLPHTYNEEDYVE